MFIYLGKKKIHIYFWNPYKLYNIKKKLLIPTIKETIDFRDKNNTMSKINFSTFHFSADRTDLTAGMHFISKRHYEQGISRM